MNQEIIIFNYYNMEYPDCRCKCRTKLSSEVLQELKGGFQHTSKESQDSYIASMITRSDPIRKKKNTVGENRENVWKYYLRYGLLRIECCRKFFLFLFEVSPKRLRVIQDKVCAGIVDFRENRGSHVCSRRIPDETWALASAHLLTIPHSESHYTKSKKKYFTNTSLTVRKLFSLFGRYYLMKKGERLNIGLRSYEKFFRRCGFGIRQPKTDVCNFCTQSKIILKQKTDLQRKSAFDLHCAKVRRYHSDKKQLIASVKNKYEKLVLEFDYSQNFAVPLLNVNDQFYRRLLWLFVFNVHCHNDGRSRMYHFLETESRKGANSVVSLVYDALSAFIHPETTSIVLYSDSAPGQNKNTIMMRFCAWVSETLHVEVQHIYPVRGHSYCVADRNFAYIRRQTRRRENIYTPGAYIQIIKSARRTKPFEVLHAAPLIKDWSQYLGDRYLARPTAAAHRQPFKLMSYCQLKYRPDNTVLASPAYSPLFNVYSIRKRRSAIPDEFSLSPIPGKITAVKKKDVLDLLQYVPRYSRKSLRNALEVDK